MKGVLILIFSLCISFVCFSQVKEMHKRGMLVVQGNVARAFFETKVTNADSFFFSQRDTGIEIPGHFPIYNPEQHDFQRTKVRSYYKDRFGKLVSDSVIVICVPVSIHYILPRQYERRIAGMGYNLNDKDFALYYLQEMSTMEIKEIRVL